MDDLSERVLKHFKIKKTEATNKLVHALRVPKKSLNSVLYKLERQSLIVKIQDTPPVWGLPEYASSPSSPSSAGRITRKRKAKEMEQADSRDNELSTKILNFLGGKKAAKPLEIAKAVGLTKHTVNPLLYNLKEKGLIMKNSDKSLTWSMAQNQDYPGNSITADPQPSTSNQHFQPVSGDFPLFQETQLFRTDISLDMEDTELLSGETDDNDLDLNEPLVAGHADIDDSLFKQETEFVDESGELDNDNTPNSVKHEVEDDIDMENSVNSEIEGHMIAGVADNGIDSQVIVKCESNEEMEDNAMTETMENMQGNTEIELQIMDSENNGQGMLREAETSMDVRLVRNVIGIDDSSNSSPHPDIPILKAEDGQVVSPELNTSDLSEMKNDHLEECDPFSVQLNKKLSPTCTPNIVDEASGKGDGVNEDPLQSVDNDSENDSDSKTNSKALGCNMDNCDKILQVLSTLPGCAEFVLVNRTKLVKADIDTALEKCQKLGFVSGCTKLWRITPDGIDYIEEKLGTADKVTPEINVGQPVQAKKFSGPPPSPMALLKSKAGLNGGSSLSQQSQPTVSNNRDRSPLNRNSFQPGVSNSQARHPMVRNNVAINSISSSQGSVKTLLNQSLFPANNSIHNTERSNDVSESSSVNSGLWDKNSMEIKSPPKNLYQNKLTRQNSSYSQSSFKQPKAPVQNETISQANIPSKYANYPNKVTSTQLLKNINSKSSGSSSDNKTMSSKPSIPPSPMEILSKNLKKTEISPPNTPTASSKTNNPMLTSSQQSVQNSVSLQRQLGGNHMSQSLNNSSSLMTGQFGKQSLVTSNTSRISGQFSNPSSVSSDKSMISGQFGTQSKPLMSLLSGQFRNQSVKSSAPSLLSGQFGNQSLSVQVNQNQSRTVQPINTEFKSLPVSMNKISGNAKSGVNSLALSNESFNALNKNAVSALMEYAQSRKMEARVQVIGQRGPPHRPTFTMAAFVGNRQFSPVTCTNKKDGRKEACDIAMRQLVAEGQFQAETASEAGGSKPQAPIEAMTHFDKIAALTHRGFTALVSQITAESFAGRKVIAGLVMKRSEDDTGVLISLGTGNRCITGQQLSLQGNTVNDSHAEIITRRGFMRFLYKQLLDYDPNKTNPLFERSRTGKLQIRPKITFHLYISTAPCGDGALFSPRDAESTKAPVDSRIRPPHEPVFSSNVQGLLRTKVEGGEGTIPIEPGFKGQTFDGIQRGERLRTMSCTDKVCRWNVVGMQGALLSHFIEPVYLDSLTLGLLYDHGHLSRAVCCRVGRGPTDIDDLLPTNYRLNHPWLGRVTTCDPPREVQKTKAVSVNWSFGDSAAEVTDGTLGLCNTSIEKGMFSRCSKRNMYNSFKSVCEKFGRQDLLTAENYKDAKMKATDFQNAREAMLCKFKENKYGPWVSKPVEEEMFTWEEN